MVPGGYHGRGLRVDLTTGEACAFPLPGDLLRRFIGGVGLGTYLLLKEAPAGVDPLSPAAPLIVALSPLVGTPLTTSAKFAVVAKSPLTGRINDALSSSHFALAAKQAGFDALVIVGRCEKPSILIIDGCAPRRAGGTARDSILPEVRIESAGDLWGQPTSVAESRLRERLHSAAPEGSPFHTAAIGPAGESLVRFSTLSNEGRHAGRGGLGAVLGAKRLKALAVRGHRRVRVADPAGLVAAAKALSARSFGPATAKYRELGTVANLLTFNRLAVLPTRNFQAGTFEGAPAISGERLAEVRGKTRSSCAACTIGCEHIYGVGGPRGDTASTGVRMEYESLFALGSLCGIDDPAAVLEATALCDDLGLDTISTGGTIAFAMECAERGWLDPRRPPAPLDAPRGVTPGAGAPPSTEWGRAELRFGNAEALLDLIRRIARRDGVGHLLAEGSRRAAAAIGGDAPAVAPHVKGLEIPGYEPRALQAMALGLAVCTRGADHNRSSAYEVDFSPRANRLAGDAQTARQVIESEDRAVLLDSLILCKFLRGVFEDLYAETAPLLAAVTGWPVTADELRRTARRLITARKVFNQREGWTPAEDILPERFHREPLPGGATAGASLPRARLQAMIEAYNRARGWTPAGHVPQALRRRLGLGD
ncbi:MAG: aldehyde ferredoxin oxidoreductase family protein [Acidobacteriota bacterium]